MKKVLHWLDENLEATICMILLTFFTVVLFIQVVMRYVFNNSLSWSEELARYVFIWLVFIGISYGAKEMKHLKIEVFLNIFPKKVRPYLVILADIIVMIFSLLVVYAGYLAVIGYMKLKVTSPALHVPYWFIHSAPIFGYGLTFIRQIQAVIYRIKELKAGDMEAFESSNDEEVML